MAATVSVIIPSYNYAKFLPDALESLLRQTFQNWECVVVDNESTDNTAEVCSEYVRKDNRIKYLFLKNDGPAKARNFGLLHTSGTYIQFLDADDCLDKDKLLRQVEYLKAHSDVDLVYGEARFFSTHDMFQRLYSMHEGNKDWMLKISGKDGALVNRLLLGNIMPVSCPLFKHELIDKYGAMDEQLKGNEDWELFLRFALNGARFQFLSAPDTFALIRTHDISLSKKTEHMKSFILPVFQKALFSGRLSFGQFVLLSFKYFRILIHVLSLKIEGKQVSIINSDKVPRYKLFLLHLAGIFYIPPCLIFIGLQKLRSEKLVRRGFDFTLNKVK